MVQWWDRSGCTSNGDNTSSVPAAVPSLAARQSLGPSPFGPVQAGVAPLTAPWGWPWGVLLLRSPGTWLPSLPTAEGVTRAGVA